MTENQQYGLATIGAVLGAIVVMTTLRDWRKGEASPLLPRPFKEPLYLKADRPTAFAVAIAWNCVLAAIFLLSALSVALEL